MVAALGYFVDIFDLLLFGIVRQSSLIAIGVPLESTLRVGIFLHNMQVWGLVIGGIFWGVLGDKRGRLSVLFGSIALYSVANIANAFITTVEAYAFWRFIAGIGLAGELGAAVTLVSETLPREVRGFGTSIVAAVGVSGAVAANYIGKLFPWNYAYLIGGILGLLLLALRIGVAESPLFDAVKASEISRGDFFSLFLRPERFKRFLRCILIGVPLWFGVGILMFYAPEFGIALKYKDVVKSGDAIAWCYGGLVLGDVLSGFMSQILGTRKKVLGLFLFLSGVMATLLLTLTELTVDEFHTLCFFFGITLGYWAVFITTSSEQFGSNLRATVTTTVPNFVRWSVSPMSLIFLSLSQYPSIGTVQAASIVGLTVFLIGFIALYGLEETYHRDMNFYELD